MNQENTQNQVRVKNTIKTLLTLFLSLLLLATISIQGFRFISERLDYWNVKSLASDKAEEYVASGRGLPDMTSMFQQACKELQWEQERCKKVLTQWSAEVEEQKQ